MIHKMRMFVVVALLAVTALFAGCGSGNGDGRPAPFGGWPNPPGPWLAELRVTAVFPDRPEGATGDAPMYDVTLTYDGGAPEIVFSYSEGSGYQETRFGVPGVRPGNHVIVVRMIRRADQKEIRLKRDSFAVSDDGTFAPDSYAYVDL